MVDEPTFPLYRLPYVALKVAFDCSHPQYILRLSMVSKKSYSICKIFRKKVVNLRVDFKCLSYIDSDDMYTIFVVRSTSEVSPDDSNLESLKIKDAVFQVKMDDCIHTLNFYCDDRLTCLDTLSEYLTDFYDVPLYAVVLDDDSITAINGVLARQQTLERCFLCCLKIGDEEIRWFLDRIENRVTQVLRFDARTHENFRLNLRQPIKTDWISFGCNHTLTIDNFSELNCRGVLARKTRLTFEYLNSYLKNWQNGGGNPNLLCLELKLSVINVDTVLNGIEFIHRHHPNNVKYGHVMSCVWLEFNESYEIKRNDGTIASILMENGQYREFKFYVWPDVYGTVYTELE